MNAVRFRRSAQADVQRADEYFESREAGLGAEFIERVEEAGDRIAAHPEAYQVVFRDIRRVDLKKFPYGLW